MPRRYELKKFFKLLLNVALAVVSYTDLGGKAQHRTSPHPMHPASTLRGILPLHPVISACGPLHTQAWIAMLVFATIGALQGVGAYTTPASVLSRGFFGKATDEATDSEKDLVKLWGGAARREVAASYRIRPPSRASFQRHVFIRQRRQDSPRIQTSNMLMSPGGAMASLGVLTASLALGKSALESVAYSLALQTAVQFESLFVSKKTMASDLKPWYVKMVLSSKSITCDFGMVPLTLMALISLGKL